MAETNGSAPDLTVMLRNKDGGTRALDLAAALPITLGDLRALGRAKVDMNKMKAGGGDAEDIFKVFKRFASKVLPDVTDDELDNLTMADMAKFTELMTSTVEIDRPT